MDAVLIVVFNVDNLQLFLPPSAPSNSLYGRATITTPRCDAVNVWSRSGAFNATLQPAYCTALNSPQGNLQMPAQTIAHATP
jgi:hypothetical protein